MYPAPSTMKLIFDQETRNDARGKGADGCVGRHVVPASPLSPLPRSPADEVGEGGERAAVVEIGCRRVHHTPFTISSHQPFGTYHRRANEKMFH